jgi:hypothetical protein
MGWVDPVCAVWNFNFCINSGRRSASGRPLRPGEALQCAALLRPCPCASRGDRIHVSFRGSQDGQAELYARVVNLLDEDYVQSFGFPEPGRYAFVGLRAKF